MKLKPHQIISSDLSIDKIEELIKSNSFSNIEYGKGREIIYCDDLIYDKLKQIFLSHKVFIDLEPKVNFEF